MFNNENLRSFNNTHKENKDVYQNKYSHPQEEDSQQDNQHFKRNWRGGDLRDTETLDHQPVQAKYLEVKVFNDNFEQAFKAFRSLVQKERILATAKANMSYEKPSQKRRRKMKEREHRIFEEAQENQRINQIK